VAEIILDVADIILDVADIIWMWLILFGLWLENRSALAAVASGIQTQ
jgi:hypothetical protein